MTERDILFSLDSTAMFGTAGTFAITHGFLLQQGEKVKAEAIGWKWLPLLMPGYKTLGVEIVGVHGKTGGFNDGKNLIDIPKLAILNRFLLTNSQLIKINGSVKYILVHSPQIAKLKERQMFNLQQKQIRTLFVENHLHGGALGAARDNALNLRADGVNAGLMVDFCHVYETESNHLRSFPEKWQRTLRIIERNLEEAKRADEKMPIGFHVPIGWSDGLPTHLMTDNEWKGASGVINRFNAQIVVVENQQNFFNSFILTPKMAFRQREVNERKINVLVSNGVISL